MAINYPTALDLFTDPTASDQLNLPSHSGLHTDINSAVEALEAKVGADGSAVTSSLDYRVTQLETRPVYFAKALRNTDLTVTYSSNTLFDSNLNLTVDAAAGDVISYTFDTYLAAGANIAHFMPYTLDSGGAIVNPVAQAGTVFNPALWTTSEATSKSFTFFYELVAGDIVSNQVTIGLTVNTAGASRQIIVGTIGMRCYLTNLGKEAS